MNITEHFDSDEFAQPAGYGMEKEPYPDEWMESRLRPLCAVLESIRSVWDKPMSILSGYRSVAYNQALYNDRGEPATNSEHSRGNAADIQISGVKAFEVHEAILDLYKQGLIQIGGLGLYDRFVHVDIRPTPDGRLRRWDNRKNPVDESGTPPDENPPSSSEEGEGDEEAEQSYISGTVMPFATIALLALLVRGRYI
jgi:hypothetical protein